MTQFYSDPSRENDPHALPDCEAFHISEAGIEVISDEDREELGFTSPGWYWWACFPGCMPDSDPVGPFETEDEAIQDARSEWMNTPMEVAQALYDHINNSKVEDWDKRTIWEKLQWFVAYQTVLQMYDGYSLRDWAGLIHSGCPPIDFEDLDGLAVELECIYDFEDDDPEEDVMENILDAAKDMGWE